MSSGHRGTGAGRYVRHHAAKENMKKTKQILWVTVYKTILLHCLPNIIVEAIGRTKVERRSSEIPTVTRRLTDSRIRTYIRA